MLSTLGSIASQGGLMPPDTLIYSPFDNSLSNTFGGAWVQRTDRGNISYPAGKFSSALSILNMFTTGGTNLVELDFNIASYSGDFTLQFWSAYTFPELYREGAIGTHVMLNTVYSLFASSVPNGGVSSTFSLAGVAEGVNITTYIWNFYRITKVGNTCYLYMNGKLLFSAPKPSGVSSINKITILLNIIASATFTNMYRCYIDDFLFTKTVLPGTEVPTRPYL
jgi:hypothetical protein